jgi:hypothetical protein
MSEAWIIDAVRTPRGVGKYGKGALHDIHRIATFIRPRAIVFYLWRSWFTCLWRQWYWSSSRRVHWSSSYR